MLNEEMSQQFTINSKLYSFIHRVYFFFSIFSVGYLPRGAVNFSLLASFSGSVAALGLDSAQALSGWGQSCRPASRPGQIKIWTRTKDIKRQWGQTQPKRGPDSGQPQAKCRTESSTEDALHYTDHKTIITAHLYQFDQFDFCIIMSTALVAFSPLYSLFLTFWIQSDKIHL